MAERWIGSCRRELVDHVVVFVPVLCPGAVVTLEALSKAAIPPDAD